METLFQALIASKSSTSIHFDTHRGVPRLRVKINVKHLILLHLELSLPIPMNNAG